MRIHYLTSKRHHRLTSNLLWTGLWYRWAIAGCGRRLVYAVVAILETREIPPLNAAIPAVSQACCMIGLYEGVGCNYSMLRSAWLYRTHACHAVGHAVSYPRRSPRRLLFNPGRPSKHDSVSIFTLGRRLRDFDYRPGIYAWKPFGRKEGSLMNWAEHGGLHFNMAQHTATNILCLATMRRHWIQPWFHNLLLVFLERKT
jgi:hypothetical protein